MENQGKMVGAVDNYDSEGKPAGCLGLVPRKRLRGEEQSPDVRLVCERAKSGYYHKLARENPTPDRYDERGIMIPPGCLGRVADHDRRIPPEVKAVIEKIKSGAYLELAKYENSLEEKANGRDQENK